MTSRIDFFARQPHYIDHMAPIHRALGPNRGSFFVPEYLYTHALFCGIDPIHVIKGGVMYSLALTPGHPLLVASHSDLQTAYLAHHGRPLILMEHGVGIVFPNNSSYAGNMGYRKHATLTLAPNQIIFDKTRQVLPEAAQAVIGTPKLDKWATRSFPLYSIDGKRPTIAISFHWDGRHVAPEAGSAFEYYKKAIIALSKMRSDVRLIAHAHPRCMHLHKPFYKSLGIEFCENFEMIMATADLYINDCSSTLYEFLVTGKPVIILNAPQFRRDVNFGIRFWDYTDVGLVANNGDELLEQIWNALHNPEYALEERKEAVRDLYPYFGYSAQVAAKEIMKVFR